MISFRNHCGTIVPSVGLEAEERQEEAETDDGRKAPATTGANRSKGSRRAAAGRGYMTIFAK